MIPTTFFPSEKLLTFLCRRRRRRSWGGSFPETRTAVYDDDIPQLSSHALEALKEFIAEQNRTLVAASSGERPEEEVALVAEDWRLSRFWYDRETAETVSREVLTLCETLESPSVACPTLYTPTSRKLILISKHDFLNMTKGKSYLLLLTGDVQRDRAAELLGLRPCRFRPQHSSKLGNEFILFTNYDPGMRLGGWEDE